MEDAAGGGSGGLLMGMLTHGEVLSLLGISAGPGGLPAGRVYRRVSDFAGAGEDAIVFALDARALVGARACGAGLILAYEGAAGDLGERVLCVKRPKLAFALCGRALEGQVSRAGVHASAVIAVGAAVGRGTSVGALTVIEDGVRIGEDCEIGPGVVIEAGTTLGDRVVVQAGVVLGGTGFGYVTGPDGRHVRFPQVGTLRIGDDVEIGAGTTVDRGALGETVIGRGTKIDNLVHIAHNCRVGEDVLIAAQVGMSGSCVIEDGAMLGGQVGLGEGVTIGRGVVLGGQGGVLPGKKLDGAPGEVFWGTPARPVREYLRDVARMRRGR